MTWKHTTVDPVILILLGIFLISVITLIFIFQGIPDRCVVSWYQDGRYWENLEACPERPGQ